jgi:hypothetical protein
MPPNHGEGEVSDGNHERKTRQCFGATLSRRQFVKTGGVLVVGFSLVGPELLKGGAGIAATAASKNTLDPTLPSSWIEIHPDNTF